jgi:hypothetical protein
MFLVPWKWFSRMTIDLHRVAVDPELYLCHVLESALSIIQINQFQRLLPWYLGRQILGGKSD